MVLHGRKTANVSEDRSGGGNSEFIANAFTSKGVEAESLYVNSIFKDAESVARDDTLSKSINPCLFRTSEVEIGLSPHTMRHSSKEELRGAEREVLRMAVCDGEGA